MSLGADTRFRIAFALLIGAAIPSVVFGRVVFATVLFLGFTALLVSDLRREAWQYLTEQAKSLLGLCVGITVILWSVSAVSSSFPLRALEAEVRSAVFVGVGVMVLGAFRTDEALYHLCLRSLIIVCAVSVLIACLSMTVLPELYWAVRLKGWLSTPLETQLKTFSSLAVILIPLLAWLARRETPRLRIVALITLLGLIFLVWETYNRAAIAGLLGISLAWVATEMLHRGTRHHILLSLGGVAITIIAVVIWLKMSRSGVIGNAPAGDWLFPVWLIDFQRQTIWAHTLDIFNQAPWFGIGANTINFTPGADMPLPGNESLHVISAHPHNWLVEVLAETGAAGLGGLLIVIGALTYRWVRAFRRTRKTAYQTALAITAGYWVSGLFNFSYWSAWWQFSFLIGLAVALGGTSENKQSGAP